MEKKQIVRLGDLTISLKTEMFSVEELNVDELLRIDIQNLSAEIVTFPIILNRLSWLVSEASALVNARELELRVFEAKYKKQARDDYDGKRDMSNEKAEEAVRSDPKYFIKKKLLSQSMQQQELVNGLYWAAKEKSDFLKRLASGMSPEDVSFSLSQLKQKTFNHVAVKLIQPEEE